jgi:hypothetical protein
MMSRSILIAALVFGVSSAAAAQTAPSDPPGLNPEVIRHPDQILHVYGYADGAPARYIATEGSGNLPSNLTATAVRAVGRWEVCDGFQFSGECKIIEGNYQRLQRTGLRRIWSARPVESPAAL